MIGEMMEVVAVDDGSSLAMLGEMMEVVAADDGSSLT
jgi:hypothetical protein